MPDRPNSTASLAARLTDRDWRILDDLERFRLLETRQIRRLEFGVGHVTTLAATRGAIRVLGRLESIGLITRLARRIGGTSPGSSASTWQLSSTGDRLLRSRRGGSTRRRYIAPSLAFAAHTLAIADLAITLVEASRRGEVELLKLEVENAAWRQFIGASGATEWLKPDVSVVLAERDEEIYAFVEIDRGTVHLPVVRRKQKVYERYFASGAEQASHDVFPAILWLTESERRARAISKALREDDGPLLAQTYSAPISSASAALLGRIAPLAAADG